MAKKVRFTLDDIKKSKVAHLNMEATNSYDIYRATGLLYYKSIEQNIYSLVVIPRGKPRMVRSDSWKKRACVMAYWSWKDELLAEASRVGLSGLPGKFKVTFYMPMPSSWSKSKKMMHDGKPHLVKSDIDNLLKALQDCLCKNDSHIHDVHAIKQWAYNGWIKIEIP